VLVDRIRSRAHLSSLLLRNFGSSLFPLPAPQQFHPPGGRLLGGANNLEALDLTHFISPLV
jgi:hypothetical protein